MRYVYYTIAALVALGTLYPVQAAPRVITREEATAIKKHEKQKKQEVKEKKKNFRDNKKRAAALKKKLVKITPLPLPEVKVDDSELEALQQAADGGDAAAMVRLGHYQMTHAKPGHKKKAGELFRRAADTGDADAIAWCALHDYITGPASTDKDGSRQKLYAAAKAAADAGSSIGTYLTALASESDDEKLELYTKAAYDGFVPAMRAMGELIARAAYENQATRHDPIPDDAKLWLEYAYRQGDSQAAHLRSGSSHMHRGTNDLTPTDPADVEKWLRNALELNLKRDIPWFGSVFDSLTPSNHVYAWGGQRMFHLMKLFSALVRVREFDNRNTAEITRECCNTIKKMAAAGEVDAIAAAVMLSRKWSFWMGLNAQNPGILKETDWLPKLKQKATQGDVLAERLIKECNMVGK